MCRFGVHGGLLTNHEWGTFLVDDYVYGEIMFLLALDVCVQEASTTSHKGHGLEGGWTLAAVLFQDTTPSVASGCSWLLAVTLGQEAVRITLLGLSTPCIVSYTGP